MTESELLSLEHHDRIKYVGTRSLDKVFEQTDYSGVLSVGVIPKTVALPKGVIVSNVWKDNSTSKIGMYFYSASVQNVDPVEWELIERRGWVEPELEYKRAKAYIPNLITDFQKKLLWFLRDYQSRAERKLKDIPVDKKLKVIMDLSPEDKVWFGVLTSEPEEAIKILKESFENNNAT